MSEQHQNIVDETKCFYKGTNKTFSRKCEFDALEKQREQELEITREVAASTPYQGIESFGEYVPTASMEDNDDSITIKVTNYNCVNQDIKLFYSTLAGDNGLDEYDNSMVKKSLRMTTDDWGGGFLSADGSLWVNDGQTLPAAFSGVIECTFFCFPVGNIVLSTTAGESIDNFLLRMMTEVANALTPPTKTLAGSSPMGVNIYYDGGVCYVNLIMYVPSGGGAQVIPLQWTITSIFPTTSFASKTPAPFGFTLTHPDGWRPYLEVTDLSDIGDRDSYQEFVRSITQQDLYVEDLRRYSTSTDQVNQTFEFLKFDLDGNEEKITQTDLVDPYQIQAVINEFADIVLDGQTYAVTTMLAGEYMEIQMSYDKVGILSLEEVEQLQTILDEQGVEISEGEQRELEESYLSFSGFSDETKKIQNIVIVGLILLLIFKK